ncbi:MAG: LysM peptidoglycan-binding domain-containing protein [Ruminococcus sp.]
MTVSNMRYKGYSFKHNPENLKVTKENNIQQQIIPKGNNVIQDMGTKARVVTGTGKLFGDDCLSQYYELVDIQKQGDSGVLSLPDTMPFYAYFKKIELVCEPTDKLVTYSFEFVEDTAKSDTVSNQSFHYVSDGETLWDISYMYNVSVEQLVSLNPQVKRIDELVKGGKIRIC